jgi:hypothetical protein
MVAIHELIRLTVKKLAGVGEVEDFGSMEIRRDFPGVNNGARFYSRKSSPVSFNIACKI